MSNAAMGRLSGTVSAYWRGTDLTQRALLVSGAVLFASMVAHGVALVATGGPATGPVSFRKAMTFAETGWLTCWSAALILPLLSAPRWERLSIAFGVLLFGLGETFVMSLQVWRGTPSHYNFSTPLDGALFGAGGVMAFVFMLSMFVLLWAALRAGARGRVEGREPAPSVLPSIRVGTLVMILGVFTGWVMISNMSGVYGGGILRVLEIDTSGYVGPSEETIGRDLVFVRPFTDGGDMVLLHAFGVHGLQIVPLAALLLSFSRLSERARTTITGWVAVSALGVISVLAIQVFRAQPFAGMSTATISLLAVFGLGLAVGYAAAGWYALRGFTAPGSPATLAPGG